MRSWAKPTCTPRCAAPCTARLPIKKAWLWLIFLCLGSISVFKLVGELREVPGAGRFREDVRGYRELSEKQHREQKIRPVFCLCCPTSTSYSSCCFIFTPLVSILRSQLFHTFFRSSDYPHKWSLEFTWPLIMGLGFWMASFHLPRLLRWGWITATCYRGLQHLCEITEALE